MKRTKIAPLPCRDARAAQCHPAMCECVAERVKALEAVARAAETVNREDNDGGGTLMPMEFWRPMNKLSDALHRLARLSRKRVERVSRRGYTVECPSNSSANSRGERGGRG